MRIGDALGQARSEVHLFDDIDVIERILKHLNVWDPQPKTTN